MSLLIFSYLRIHVCCLFFSLSLYFQTWKYLRSAMKPFGYLILFYFGKYKSVQLKANIVPNVYAWFLNEVKAWHGMAYKWCLIHSIEMWVGKITIWPLLQHGAIFPTDIVSKPGLHTEMNILKGHLLIDAQFIGS